MPDPVPLPCAARFLKLSVRQLRRDIAAGAPLARRGRRGRGGAALVDVDAIAAWRALQGGAAQPDLALLTIIASEIPTIVADAIDEQFREINGPHKRPCGPEFAAVWYRIVCALLDRIRRDVPTTPDVNALPAQIDRLRHI